MPVIIKKKNSLHQQAVEKFKRQKAVLFYDNASEQHHQKYQNQKQQMQKVIQRIEDTKLLVRETFKDVERTYMQKKTVVLIVHYLAEDNTDLIAFLVYLKQKKNTPLFFLTTHPEGLVTEYRAKLFAYQEADDFVTLPLKEPVFYQKIQRMMAGNFRKAKRFKMSDPVFYMLPMIGDERIEASLLDISLSGFYISTKNEIFKTDQQLQLQIPLARYRLFRLKYGELLKLGAKVERVNISGNEAGCSLLHVEEIQKEILLVLIEKIFPKPKLPPRTKKSEEEGALKKKKATS